MGKSILIVDDSTSMRWVIRMTLQDKGFKVVEAVNGKDGLSKLAINDIDLVISDLHMPEMDGFEFIRNIRSNQKYRYLPVLVLTTEANPELQQEAKNAGATAWIMKPFTAEKLLIVIQKLVPAMFV
ncbi:MAG: response regulator [Brevinematales bacterium]|nr:response regulator [Brevinematales bacterium]